METGMEGNPSAADENGEEDGSQREKACGLP